MSSVCLELPLGTRWKENIKHMTSIKLFVQMGSCSFHWPKCEIFNILTTQAIFLINCTMYLSWNKTEFVVSLTANKHLSGTHCFNTENHGNRWCFRVFSDEQNRSSYKNARDLEHTQENDNLSHILRIHKTANLLAIIYSFIYVFFFAPERFCGR